MTDSESDFNERRALNSTLRSLQKKGFSWIEEEVRVKPEDRERAFILDAVVYITDEEGEQQPYILVDIKENPGSWALEQMQPYAEHLDARYIHITNGSRKDWYQVKNGEKLDGPPDPPRPGEGARPLEGPEQVRDLMHYFTRQTEWDREEYDGLMLTALLLKYAHERERLSFDPTSSSSMRTTLRTKNPPDFIRRHSRDLESNWDRLWRFMNSFSFPDDFSWSRLLGWIGEEQRRFRIDDTTRTLLPPAEAEFVSGIVQRSGSSPVGVIEGNLGAVALNIARNRKHKVTLFEHNEEMERVIRSLLWVDAILEGNRVVGADPLRANIVEQFQEKFRTMVLLPTELNPLDNPPAGFELDTGRGHDGIYLEGGLQMLEPGGMLVAVVPDVLLSGERYQQVRSYLLEHTRLIGSFQLPANESRRKDAVCLVARKRGDDEEDEQGEVLMSLKSDTDEDVSTYYNRVLERYEAFLNDHN